MKLFILALILTFITSIASAGLPEKYLKACESDEVKFLMGKGGSCEVVVSPKKLNKQGQCSGLLMGLVPCEVSFIIEKDKNILKLICEDAGSAIINETLEIEAISYKMAIIIKTSEGKVFVKNNNDEYNFFSNQFMELFITESTQAGTLLKTGTFTINLPSGPLKLNDFNCD